MSFVLARKWCLWRGRMVLVLLDGADNIAVIVQQHAGVHRQLAHVGLRAGAVRTLLLLAVAASSRVPPYRARGRLPRQSHAAEVGQPVAGAARD